jgi:hypothetical protein
MQMEKQLRLEWNSFLESLNAAAIAGDFDAFVQKYENQKVSCSGIISDIILSDIHCSAILDIGYYEYSDSNLNKLICDAVVANIRHADKENWSKLNIGDAVNFSGVLKSNALSKHLEIQSLRSNQYYVSILISDAVPVT